MLNVYIIVHPIIIWHCAPWTSRLRLGLMCGSYSHQVAQSPHPAPRPGLQWETQNSAWITRPFIAHEVSFV